MEAYKRYFSNLAFLTDETFNVLFTDILKLDSGVSLYEEVTDHRKLYKILENKQHDYNYSSNDKLDLVFFDDAVEQILRICRILRQPRGNAPFSGRPDARWGIQQPFSHSSCGWIRTIREHCCCYAICSG